MGNARERTGTVPLNRLPAPPVGLAMALTAAAAVALTSAAQIHIGDLLAARDRGLLELLPRQGLAALAWLLAGVGVVWLARRVPVRREGAARSIVIHGAAALSVAAFVNILIPALWALAGLSPATGASFLERALGGFFGLLHVNVLVYVVVSGAVQLLDHRGAAGENERAATGHVRRLAVPGERGTTLVEADAIRWVEAAGDYVRLHLPGESRLLSARMWALERKLDPERFVRVHRSAIVRLDAVRELRPLTSGDAIAVLDGGDEVRVSRRRRRGLTALGAFALAATVLAAPGRLDAQTPEASTVQDSTDILYSVTGLAGPEAVRYDPDQDVYFIASFGESADEPRDANGFISRVSADDGAVESLRFMTGTAEAPLHMPRGMFIRGDTLWVADVDGVHGFLRQTGQHAAFIDFTAHAPGFLNDVAVGADGLLYVTDTGLGRVYRVRADGVAEVAIEDERTGPPNGITWDRARSAFLLAPWQGETMLRAWDPATGEIRDVTTLVGGRFDGIEVVDGAVLVASQDDSTLHRVEGDAPRPLIRVPGRPADIGVDTRRGRVAVPYIALDRVDIWTLPPRPYPRSGADQAQPRLIGLVELPGVFGARDPDGPPGAVRAGEAVPVPLHAEPEPGSPRVATVSSGESLQWREFDYEAPAAVAYGEAAGWVRVALREDSEPRYVWVPPEHRGPLHRLDSLLEHGLSYMTDEWDGLLRAAPSRAAAVSRPGRDAMDDPVAMNVLQVVQAEGATWLEVELLGPGRCQAAPQPAVVATGWVPTLAHDGRPNAWFYSRGC